MAGIVMVGAGHAAGQAAASLRQGGYEGDITIIGDEAHIPYQRPPLSKQYLSGEHGVERVYLRPQKFYEDKGIDVRTGKRLWKGGRYGSGEVLLVGQHLIVSTESGEVAIVEANPERHVEVARFEAIEGKTWNHPVLVDDVLLVRNHREMAAFDLSGP